jgi:hypothetical protein
VLATVLTELAIIGGLANQWVMDRLIRHVIDQSITLRLLVASWFTYAWRLSPRSGRSAEWWGEIALIATVVVVSSLIVWCLVRGPISFWRALFATWLAVVFASLLGAFVRGVCNPDPASSGLGDRVTRGLYGGSGPSQEVAVGAFALGLVVALIVALVAVATRRRAGLATEADVGPPQFADYGPPPATAVADRPPWQDQHYGPPAGHRGPPPGPPYVSGRGEPAGEATTQLPRGLETDRPASEQGAGANPDQPGERPADQPGERPADQPGERPADQPGPPPADHPAQRSADQPTTQLPAMPHPSAAPPAPPSAPGGPPPSGPPPGGPPPGAAGNQPTTRFPRPPDDEELGHIEH